MKKIIIFVFALTLLSCKGFYNELSRGIWKLTSVDVIQSDEVFEELQLNDSLLEDTLFEYAAREVTELLLSKGVHLGFDKDYVYYLEMNNDSVYAYDNLTYFTNKETGNLHLSNGSILEIKSVENGIAIIHIEIQLTELSTATQVFTLKQDLSL